MGYGDCVNHPEDEACFGGETCLGNGLAGVCALVGCNDDSECLPPPGGEAPAVCMDLGVLACVLDCTAGQACPDGMTCLEGLACGYWLAPEGGGVCPDVVLDEALPFSVDGNTVGFSDDHIPTCAFFGSGGQDVLYEFTAPDAGFYVFHTDDATMFDTQIYVLDGCDGDELGCNDASIYGDSQPRLTIELAADQIVIVGLDSLQGTAGPFTMFVEYAPAVAGGSCCIAQPDGVAGCDVPAIEDCVCAIQGLCCSDTWTAECVGYATPECFADCG